MTFKQFAFNNVKRNTRAYLSYFLSCVFAVTVFFMYAVVVFHPNIAETEFQDVVQSGVLFSEFIIYGFSFLFVLYSTASFIKSRKKEYGLLTTLGISKSQLNRMLILENTIIGIAAILTGLVVGSLLMKVFLMIFSQVLGLGEVLPFYISFQAIGLTALLFFIMFELNSLAVVWTLRTKAIMDVFRGTTAAKKEPRFSWILSTLSLLAIGYAYYLAYTADLMAMMLRMLPILALIIPGTYFLFTQFSIAFTKLLKRNKHYYYRHLNLLTLSDLTFKLKDNARLLFFVTILSAVAFTSSGVLYGLFQSVAVETERFVPQDVSMVTQSEANIEAFKQEVDKVEKQFHDKDIPFTSMIVKAVGIKANSDVDNWNDMEQTVYSYSDYKKMIEMNEKHVTFQAKSKTAYMLINDIISPIALDIPSKLTFLADGEATKLHIEIEEVGINNNMYTSFPIVVADDVYHRFYQAAATDEVYYNYVMHVPNWMHFTDDIIAIMDSIDHEVAYADSKADFYQNMKEGMSYSFFFGIFISVLFFLAAGSILYFRMYQDIDKDLHHFHSLYRIGLTDKEMEKIVTMQLGFLFFIPFFVAVVHAGFAFKALQNMLASSITIPSIIVITIYFIVHFANFIFIRNIYTAKLRKVM